MTNDRCNAAAAVEFATPERPHRRAYACRDHVALFRELLSSHSDTVNEEPPYWEDCRCDWSDDDADRLEQYRAGVRRAEHIECVWCGTWRNPAEYRVVDTPSGAAIAECCIETAASALSAARVAT